MRPGFSALVGNVDYVEAACALGAGVYHGKMPGVNLWRGERGN